MVCGYGMATMTHRATFALDSESIRRLKKLAARWQVSQAEVVRRALAQAEARPEAKQPDPVTILRALHSSGQGLDRRNAEAYLAKVYADRRRWRGE
jgi:predicted transcriptional regulator